MHFGRREELSRMLKVGAEIGAMEEALQMDWSGLPSALEVMVRRGVDLKTIHAIWAKLIPDRLAVVDGRREVSFQELNEEINRLATGLVQHYQVGPGRPLMVAMKNRAEYLVAWMAAARLGVGTIHASWRQTSEELKYQIEHSGAGVVVADQSVDSALRPLELEAVIAVGEGVEGRPYDEVIAQGSRRMGLRRGGRRQSENIVYTSGTTGRPKGAVRDMAAYGVVEFAQILERLPLKMGERHLVVSPIYHSGGQIFSLMETALGSTLYLAEEFDAESTLAQMHDEAINTIFLVPTMLRKILELGDGLHERYGVPSLRGILCGAAPFPEALRRRAVERFGAEVIHDFYGATEIGWITVINGQEMKERPGSVGRPLAGQEVRILDEDGQEMDTGEVGTIYVRNHHLMGGYLKNEEATEEIRRGGWMTVDDLGYVDEEGYLYLAGRVRDMVISGGVNIYPAEIENVLMEHPAVREIAVIGVDDEAWGEALVAVVVVEEGEGIDEQGLVDYAKERLTDYKVPRRWERVEELPRNPTGKVLKRELRERFEM